MLADIDNAPDEPTRQRRLAAYNQLVQKGMDQTGQTKVDQRLQTVEPAPDAPPGERPKAAGAQANKRQNIMKANGVNIALAQKVGAAAVRDTISVDVDAVRKAGVAPGYTKLNTDTDVASAVDAFGGPDELTSVVATAPTETPQAPATKPVQTASIDDEKKEQRLARKAASGSSPPAPTDTAIASAPPEAQPSESKVDVASATTPQRPQNPLPPAAKPPSATT
jgi:hypothetical protein